MSKFMFLRNNVFDFFQEDFQRNVRGNRESFDWQISQFDIFVKILILWKIH